MFISRQWVEQNFTIVEELPEKNNTFYITREGQYFSLYKIIKKNNEIIEEVILDISLVNIGMSAQVLSSMMKKFTRESEIYVSKKELKNFNGYSIQNIERVSDVDTQKEDISGLWLIQQQKNAKIV